MNKIENIEFCHNLNNLYYPQYITNFQKRQHSSESGLRSFFGWNMMNIRKQACLLKNNLYVYSTSLNSYHPDEEKSQVLIVL